MKPLSKCVKPLIALLALLNMFTACLMVDFEVSSSRMILLMGFNAVYLAICLAAMSTRSSTEARAASDQAANNSDSWETQTREFLSNAAHDLRTPVTCIRGYLETLEIKDALLSAEERKEYIDAAIKNADGLSELIDDLFTLAKLDEAQNVNLTQFRIDDSINLVASRLNALAEKKGLTISVVQNEYPAYVTGDKRKIERALFNIVQNAIYYSKLYSTVEIALCDSDSSVRVEIIDHGIGIAEGDLPHIGTRFFRANRDRGRSSGGNGLGLAIAKSILTLHGSSLSIVSALNRGTTVSFELPRANLGYH